MSTGHVPLYYLIITFKYCAILDNYNCLRDHPTFAWEDDARVFQDADKDFLHLESN